MRVGQSIWSRKDFDLNNPKNSIFLSTTGKTLTKFYSQSDVEQSFDNKNNELQEEPLLPHGNIINSSKKLFANISLRNRIYEQNQLISKENPGKLTYYFRETKIVVEDSGPFWPMAFPIKHPTPSFSFLTRNAKHPRLKEYYYLPDDPFLGENQHQQTYDNQPAIHKYTDAFKHSILMYDMDKSPRLQQCKTFDSEQTCPSLMFESRFEGGNLRQVKRVGQFEYELVLRPDLYTRRHTQWYYFRVQNMIANITYRLRIINLMKKTSLYSDGMRILLYSDVAGKRELRGWYRAGHHINYAEYKQRNHNPLLERDINYFELDFQIEFPYSGDTCYIAHCYPYTFTDLKDDLDYLSLTRPRDVFRREVLCESQAGNSCFLVTVTDESVPIEEKKFVFITARIHPGETNASYMMRGLLEFITSEDKIAKKLRSLLVFKIVPMLNPDGVIIGNYRCSLTGKDMNRNFRHPRKHTFPTIFHIKEMIQNLQKEQREILAFCDLHGHSRKSNVFAYGCDGCDGPQPDMKNFLNARLLPFIMSRTAPEMFSFDFCKFHIHRCKESTGRVVMWKEMSIKNSFTLEASFAGSSILEKPCHFNIQDYEKFGQCICESLRHYIDILADTARLDSIFMDITKAVLRKLGKVNLPAALLPAVYPEEKRVNEPVSQIKSVTDCLQALSECHETINEQDASSSSDSDSDPEGGELPDIPFQNEEKGMKTKSKKKRSERPERTFEERVQRMTRKRKVNRSQALKATIPLANEGSPSKIITASNNDVSQVHESHRRIRVPYPFASEINMSSQLKLTLAVDQIDKAMRSLPPKSNLFTSKYANRSGNGLPIFTTERAMERKQKRSNSSFHDISLERQMTDDNDSDIDRGIASTRERSQPDASITADGIAPASALIFKRTAPFVSLTLRDLPSPMNDSMIPTISGTLVSQRTPFKTLPQRRLQRFSQRRQQTQQQNRSSNNIQLDQMYNTTQVLTMSHLTDLTTTMSPILNLSTSTNNVDTSLFDSPNKYSYESQIDSNGVTHHRLLTVPDHFIRPFSKNETAVTRNSQGTGAKMPIINGHKRSPSQLTAATLPKQSSPTIESVLRERSIVIGNENIYQPDPMERVNSILKQLYLPTEKTKRT